MKAEDKVLLVQHHYLGHVGARARLVYGDGHGIIVFSGCTSRRLPRDWLELSRWCLIPGALGSRQWAACVKWLRPQSDATTVVSYSDPSVGHTGALYRACGWVWAPVWHVIREPPTGSGIRAGKIHRAKHRWVFLLKPDDRREDALRLNDEAIQRRLPWLSYREPHWKRGVPQLTGKIQGRYSRWQAGV